MELLKFYSESLDKSLKKELHKFLVWVSCKVILPAPGVHWCVDPAG